MPKLRLPPENPDDPQPIRPLIDGSGYILDPEPEPKSESALGAPTANDSDFSRRAGLRVQKFW